MIRQFSVFENPSPRSREAAPFIVVMQSHFLEAMHTVLVAPLIRETGSGDFSRISVAVSLLDEDLQMSLAEMAPIRRRSLGQPVGDLGVHEDDIRRALDRLFTGF